jgi:hypothetical protein
VGDGLHSFDAGDPVLVTDGQELNDRELVPQDETILAGQVDAGGKRLFQGTEEAEEDERDHQADYPKKWWKEFHLLSPLV